MTPEPPKARDAFLWKSGLIVLFAVLMQLRGLWGEAAVDDHYLLESDDQRGCGLNPMDCFSGPLFFLYYRPLLSASFSLGVRLHGTAPFLHHLENLLLFAIVVWQFLFIFRRVFGKDRPALLSGLLFALHPLQVCVATFIGGRTDTLALFFVGWCVLGLLRQNDGWQWRLLAFLGYTGAIFTKEQCLLLLPLFPLLTSYRERRADEQPVLGAFRQSSSRTKLSVSSLLKKNVWLLIFLLPTLLYVGLARKIAPAATFLSAGWTPTEHTEMVGRTLWQFVLVGSGLSTEAVFKWSLGLWDTPQYGAVFGAAIVGGFWLVLLWRARKNPVLRFFALWTTLTILPCLNLIPAASQFFAAFRLVIPLVGLAGIGGYALDKFLAQSEAKRLPSWAKVVPFVLLFVVWGVQTQRLVSLWTREIAVLRSLIQAEPTFLPPYTALGEIYTTRNDFANALPVYEAGRKAAFAGETNYEARRAMLPTPAFYRKIVSQTGLSYNPPIMLNRLCRQHAYILMQLSRYAEAETELKLALDLIPDDNWAQNSLAVCHARNVVPK